VPAVAFFSILHGNFYASLAISAAVMIFFNFWWQFDGLYNKLTGQRWDRIGTTSKLDKWQQANPLVPMLKYAGALLGLVIYILIYLNLK
jgi:hypothetical protein